MSANLDAQLLALLAAQQRVICWLEKNPNAPEYKLKLRLLDDLESEYERLHARRWDQWLEKRSEDPKWQKIGTVVDALIVEFLRQKKARA